MYLWVRSRAICWGRSLHGRHWFNQVAHATPDRGLAAQPATIVRPQTGVTNKKSTPAQTNNANRWTTHVAAPAALRAALVRPDARATNKPRNVAEHVATHAGLPAAKFPHRRPAHCFSKDASCITY